MRVETKARRGDDAKHARTCVGCGVREDAATMVRVLVAGGEVVYGRLFRRSVRPGAPGRGAHVHPRPACIARAPRGLSRAFRAGVRVDAGDLGRRLVAAADAAMVELLLAARRQKLLAVGAEADAALIIVALDAYCGEQGGEQAVGQAIVLPLDSVVASGRAIAWKTKKDLGDLLGEEAVAFYSVRDRGIASQLIQLRAAADAGSATAKAAREGAECSKCPEAR